MSHLSFKAYVFVLAGSMILHTIDPSGASLSDFLDASTSLESLLYWSFVRMDTKNPFAFRVWCSIANYFWIRLLSFQLYFAEWVLILSVLRRVFMHLCPKWCHRSSWVSHHRVNKILRLYCWWLAWRVAGRCTHSPPCCSEGFLHIFFCCLLP